ATTSATAILGTVGGTAQTTGYKNISFSGIATINVTDSSLLTHVQMGDLFVRGTENADTIQFGATFSPTTASINVNTSSYTLALGPALTAKTFVYDRGGDDYASGGYGDVTMVGGDANDRLYGGPGADTITGGNGNDLIAGNAGNDRLYGGAGNDVVIGGDGADYLTGDANDDLLFDGGVTVSSPSGTDASTLFSDANDLAMQALLSDWNDNLHVDLSIVSNHDGFVDSLSGGLGNDTASKGTSPSDTGDWENTIP